MTGWVRGSEQVQSSMQRTPRPQEPGSRGGGIGTGMSGGHSSCHSHRRRPKQCSSPANLPLLLAPGCLAEQWSGKKGDTAALGGKKPKKKSSRAQASGGSKQRKELGDPGPEEDEGVQQASPLTRSPPDEL